MNNPWSDQTCQFRNFYFWFLKLYDFYFRLCCQIVSLSTLTENVQTNKIQFSWSVHSAFAVLWKVFFQISLTFYCLNKLIWWSQNFCKFSALSLKFQKFFSITRTIFVTKCHFLKKSYHKQWSKWKDIWQGFPRYQNSKWGNQNWQKD